MRRVTVPERFHARYFAVAKTYRYRTIDGPSGNPLLRRFARRVAKALDMNPIHGASRLLVGTHDFAAFAAERGKANTTRTIHLISLDRPEIFGSRSLAPPTAPPQGLTLLSLEHREPVERS